MSNYNKKDMELLSEAYTRTLLKEQAPYMPIDELQVRMQNMSEVELQYMVESLENINEAFGGLFGGLKNVGSGLAQGAKRVGTSAASSLADKARQAGGAIAAGAGAAKQAAQAGAGRVADVYKTGAEASKRAKLQAQAQKLIDQLKALYVQSGQDENTFDRNTLADLITMFDASAYSQHAADKARSFG